MKSKLTDSNAEKTEKGSLNMQNREEVVTVVGNRPGKTVTIMGGVHGDEPCGIHLLDTLVRNLRIDRGRAHLIYGNPRAIEAGVRQIDMNLNRAFRFETLLRVEERNTYERQRALEIMPYLRESDALLDIHSTQAAVSTPFIICEPHSFGIARRLPFLIRSWGWDAIHPGSTDYFMNRCGGYGICVECGQHQDPAAIERAQTGVKVFLAVMELVDGETVPKFTTSQREVYAYGIYHTEVDFVPARQFADFEPLQEGGAIGTDGGKPVHVPKRVLALFVKHRHQPLEEAFITARETDLASALR